MHCTCLAPQVMVKTGILIEHRLPSHLVSCTKPLSPGRFSIRGYKRTLRKERPGEWYGS